jgi:ABC-type lipoprotein export system ATPase subunit
MLTGLAVNLFKVSLYERVGIARALVKEPAILLADEPTGNLDSQSSVEIMAMLQQLNREEGITILVVTHEPDIAEHTQRVISMLDGLVVMDETTRQSPEGASSDVDKEGTRP